MTIDDTTLAIHGGPPTRHDPMPRRKAMGDTERAAVMDVLDWYRQRDIDPPYQGEFEARYCDAFVRMQCGGYADAVATGTAAVFIALAALDLPPGSEILVSPISDPGSYSAIVMNRLVPRLMDSIPGEYGVGMEQVLARITSATKAVLIVHICGRVVRDIASIADLCKARGIPLIEDCSQAHGASVNGRLAGVFGDVAAFSTMYRKAHISGGCGGLVYTRDQNLFRQGLAHADRGKTPWIEGFDDRDPNHFLFPALNLHTDEISAAIGLASLERLPHTNARRRAYVAALASAMAATSRVCRLHPFTEEDAPFILPVTVDVSRLRVSKIEFATALRAEGIDLNPHYKYVAAEWAWLRPYLADDFATPNAKSSRDQSFVLFLNENYDLGACADTVSALAKVEHHSVVSGIGISSEEVVCGHP